MPLVYHWVLARCEIQRYTGAARISLDSRLLAFSPSRLLAKNESDIKGYICHGLQSYKWTRDYYCPNV